MGSWKESWKRFVICFGESPEDCLRRVDEALADYTYADFQAMHPMWLEHWRCVNNKWEWYPLYQIGLRRFKMMRKSGKTVSVKPPQIRGLTAP